MCLREAPSQGTASSEYSTQQCSGERIARTPRADLDLDLLRLCLLLLGKGERKREKEREREGNARRKRAEDDIMK
eukprot:6951561-Pyramimonas_sp.AAC.1